MSRRQGEGPVIIKDGARMKQTFTGKDLCYIHGCTGRPAYKVAFRPRDNEMVWMCKRHSGEYGAEA